LATKSSIPIDFLVLRGMQFVRRPTEVEIRHMQSADSVLIAKNGTGFVHRRLAIIDWC